MTTIAVSQSTQRVTDIDRTLPIAYDSAFLIRILGLLAERLYYLSPKKNQSKLDLRQVSIGSIDITNLTSLGEYFTLRHSVYSVMGYLDHQTEGCTAKMEISEADSRSAHIGAYLHVNGGRRLIGCARVITNLPTNPSLKESINILSKNDAVLRSRVSDTYTLALPIFQTHEALTKKMIELERTGSRYGEISRVIVAPGYAGAGLFKPLFERTLELCQSRNILNLFLECLDSHCTLYSKYGFKQIDSPSTPVAHVGRSMRAMEMPPLTLAGMTFTAPLFSTEHTSRHYPQS